MTSIPLLCEQGSSPLLPVVGDGWSGSPRSGHPTEPCSAFYHRSLFHDVDDQAGWPGSSFTQRYDQVGSGGFRGEMARIDVPDAYILWEKTNQRILQHGQSAGLALFWIWRVDGNFRCNGQTLDVTTPLMLGSGSEYEVLSDPADAIAIHISEDALRSWCDVVEGFELRGLDGSTPNRVLPVDFAAGMQRTFHEYFVSVRGQATSSVHPDLRENLRDLLFQFFFRVIAAPQLEGPDTGRRGRNLARIISRARDYIEANKHCRISVTDLCRHAGTCRRNLHYAFVNELGVTPLSFLRAVRLNAVRRDIKQITATGESLADIAARWGFFHLSHFAADYRRRFGELPSKTARAAR